MGLVVCAIVKNEEGKIAPYVERVGKYADQIIIVDNGSSDSSYDQAKELGCTTYKCISGQLDLARNKYLEYSKGAWVLSLDLDEIILEQDGYKVKRCLENLEKDIKGIYLPSLQYYGDGKWATFYMCRLYKNDIMLRYDKPIHGSIYKGIIQQGYSFSTIDINIHHFDGLIGYEHNLEKRSRNISFIEEQLENEKISASTLCFYASELFAMGYIDKAFKTIQSAIDADKDSHTYAHLFCAQMNFNIGKYEEAVRNISQQKNICKNRIILKDRRMVLYEYISDAINVLEANYQCCIGEYQKAQQIVLESIRRNPIFVHNYINMYYLSKNDQYLEEALERNPFLLDPLIYQRSNTHNIYRLQSSILNQIDMNLYYNILTNKGRKSKT